MRPTILCSLAMLTLGPCLIGQDTGKATDQATRKGHGARLRKILETNAGLTGVAFDTRHKKINDASFRGVQGMAQPRGRQVSTSGVWSQELLFIELSDSARVVFHGRRMIARDDDHEWTLRHGHHADGKPIGFALDPRTLFAALAGMDLEVVHQGVGTLADMPVQTFSVEVGGADARTLLWSGAIPTDGPTGAAGGAGMLQVFAAGGARGRAGAQPDIKVDLAITFDPASRNIVKVQGRSLNTGGAAGAAGFGAVVLRGVNLGGQQQGEDEEADEADPKQKPAVVGSFEDGLPVRAKKELEKSTVIEFTYTFSKHGEAVPGTLDARARHLLGLPSGR